MDRTPRLRQLRYFVALAEEAHYRRAAERSGVSQPTLSEQISALEQRLGAKLVEPGRGARLTPVGREVLARSRTILAQLGDLVEAVDEVRSGARGTLRLGASSTLGPYFLPRVLARLHAACPELRLVVRDASPRRLMAELEEGRHDLILAQLPLRAADLVVERLFREPLHLVVARDHPLAVRGEATDADLEGLDLLALEPDYPLYAQIAEHAARTGAILRHEYEGTSLDALRQMVAMGLGAAFLPALYTRSEVREADGDVVALRYRDGRFTRSVGVAWRHRAGRAAATTNFVETAVQVARDELAGVIVLESR
ncbi:LysR family transcriptional regulator [Limimaricola pyoseonensis]|uniref:Transcriptional regulator, LysR family n=1 Tax=Limimaricola pyoseonensis TaxID=521013 RepID=A0A1G7JIA9_9RHOB|nr:hydrogen peroxide-inducible genes activator [Limimaricola pyoseonensis]SDF24633.1 transcriptional regulator, LysR family [Limimaricola pyoseonensis]